MTCATARPLPLEAQRMLAVTAGLWKVVPHAGPMRSRRASSRPEGVVMHAELRKWPYWPALPAAAAGWR